MTDPHTTSESRPDSPPVSKGSVLIVAMVGSFITPFMTSAINMALPSIGDRFSMNAVLLSWVATAYLLSAAVFMVPFGRLADLYGRKNAYGWGMAVYTLSSLLCGLSVSGGMLIAARVLQGLGAAMIFSAGLAIITSVFPPGERGRAIGLAVASTYTGLSLGPVLGGLLTDYLGWRSVFLVNVPLGLLTVALLLAKIKTEWAEARGERFDLAGSVIYGISLVALMYGMTLLPQWECAPLIAFGLIGLAGFVIWERRVDHPVFEVNLFRTNRVFVFSSLAALIHYSATFALVFLLSLYLQYIHGLKPQEAGLILAVQPVVMAVLSPLAGRLSDRIQPLYVASLGMTITSAGLFAFGFLGTDTSLAFMLAFLALIGLGYALFSSPNMNAIMSSVETRQLGIASGAVATMRLLGQMTSMGVATVIFALLLGRVQITPEYYPRFLTCVKTSFLIFGLACFLGIFASMTRGKLKEPQE